MFAGTIQQNTREVDVILSDQRMPRTSGVQLLEWACQHAPKTVRLLMTGFAELEDAVQAINRSQVYRYLFKPCGNDQMLTMLRDAARTFLMERSHAHLVAELHERIVATVGNPVNHRPVVADDRPAERIHRLRKRVEPRRRRCAR